MLVNEISRRRFLKGLGGVVIALPYLPSVMGEAFAAAAAPKRFIFVFTSNGQRPGNWYPRTPMAWQQLASGVRAAPLTGTGDISRVLGSAFNSVRSKLLLIRGLGRVAVNLGVSHMPWYPLSAAGDGFGGGVQRRLGVSVDQVLANSSKVYPTGVPGVRFINMLVGEQSQGLGYGSTSVSNAGGNLIDPGAEWRPTVNYARLFNGFNPVPPDPTEQLRKQKRLSLMDRIRGEYDALYGSPKLGSEDKKRLEAHVTHLSDLKARLTGSSGSVGAACSDPGPQTDLSNQGETNLPALTTKNIDLLVAAIKCDRARVASLMLCPGTDLRAFGSLPGAGTGDHHSMSHTVYLPNGQTPNQWFDDPNGTYMQIGLRNRWYGDRLAELLTKLDVIEDPTTGRTYLDNSLVYWGNEDGMMDNDSHHNNDMPVLLAGSCGGVLQTGRYVDYSKCSLDGQTGTRIASDYQGSPFYPSFVGMSGPYVGRPYNALLVTILRAMGLVAADYEQNGQPGFGDYSGNYINQFNLSEGQQPLPFLGV